MDHFNVALRIKKSYSYQCEPRKSENHRYRIKNCFDGIMEVQLPNAQKHCEYQYRHLQIQILENFSTIKKNISAANTA